MWCTRSRPANAQFQPASRCDLGDSQQTTAIYRSNSLLPSQKTHRKRGRNLRLTIESTSTYGFYRMIPLFQKLRIVNLFTDHCSSLTNRPLRLLGTRKGFGFQGELCLQRQLFPHSKYLPRLGRLFTNKFVYPFFPIMPLRLRVAISTDIVGFLFLSFLYGQRL